MNSATDSAIQIYTNVASDSAIQIDMFKADLEALNYTLQNNHAELCEKLEVLEKFEQFLDVMLEYQSVVSGVLLFFTLCLSIWLLYRLFRIFF